MAKMTRTCAMALLLALSACSGGGGSDGAGNGEPVALVSLATAQRGSVAHTVALYGAVERGPNSLYTLASPVEAIVASVPAPAGSAVSRGQLVARLTPTPATRADLASAQSEARTAKAAFARAQRLRADGLASDADVESARARAESAQARLASLTAQRKGLDLRAPGAGHVETIVANPGDIVAAGAMVATISHGGSMRARFGADPAVARHLSPGETLTVAPTGGGGHFAVRILAVDPTVDPQTRLASVTVRIPPRRGIGPGQPLTGEVVVARSGSAVTIPYKALLDDGGQPYVFVVKGGVAHRHDVTTGPANSDRVAIASGVAPGDEVVVAGGTAVEDGMKVRTK